ncbi:MAG TPA: YecA family protein [Gammaproteobacteria bacterium]
MTLPTFDQTEDALRRANVLVDASECHGTLCALISAGKAGLKQQWLAQTLEDTDPAASAVIECRRLLDSLWNETHESLVGQSFDFEPLLPESNIAIGDRVEALTQWCDGFMYGLGLAEIESFEKLPQDVAEVLRDFADIGRGNLALSENAEEDELAFMELSEYLRVGTQLVHDELNPPRASQFRAPPGVH